ncbi:MAG: hypothetical protein U0802_12610 [Candidatus Binatia bacterium]
MTDAGVRLDLRFTVAESTLTEEPLAPGPEPTLSPDELAAWNAAWEQWTRSSPSSPRPPPATPRRRNARPCSTSSSRRATT